MPILFLPSIIRYDRPDVVCEVGDLRGIAATNAGDGGHDDGAGKFEPLVGWSSARHELVLTRGKISACY